MTLYKSVSAHMCIVIILILKFLGANDILEVLDLSWNQIRGKGAIAVAKGIGVSNNINS